jgi:hypothetical protein
MSTPTIHNPARAAFEEAIASALTPGGQERYRLDRLLELRAVIESLRAERGPDPLQDTRDEQHRYCHS